MTKAKKCTCRMCSWHEDRYRLCTTHLCTGSVVETTFVVTMAEGGQRYACGKCTGLPDIVEAQPLADFWLEVDATLVLNAVQRIHE